MFEVDALDGLRQLSAAQAPVAAPTPEEIEATVAAAATLNRPQTLAMAPPRTGR